MYRVMKAPPRYKTLLPYYVEAWVPGGWFRRGFWQHIGFYESVQEAREGIERTEKDRREHREAQRQVPVEIGFGYVAIDGKFYWLRDDE